jgi:hypothetical protein
MKHLFLPLPIETVRNAWEEWRSTNDGPEEDVRLLETSGGCFIVTSTGRPPRVFVDLLKTALSQEKPRLARAS